MRYVPTRHLLALMGLIAALMLGLVFTTPTLAYSVSLTLPTPNVTCGSCGGGGGDSFYGADQTRMTTAISKAQWPQQKGNWCGIADILALNWYDQIKTFGSNVSPLQQTQQSVTDVLNTQSAISPWGQATRVSSDHPAFVADIAADGGTDPRAMAWGAWKVTPNGFYFHNWIYNFPHTTGDPYGGYQATYAFGSDFGPAHGLNDPIMVAINEGAHWFIIDGVWATSDPSAGGEAIDAIDTWDPNFGNGTSFNSSRQESWSTYDWMNKYYSFSGSYLWARPYNKNNTFGDPEPSTTSSNYYNAPTSNVPNHWNGFYVTVEQDLVTRCQASANLAYDQNGNEVPHNGAAYCP